MTTFADIDRLADRIAALVTAQDRSSDFWDMEDIAYHLRASKSTAMKWAMSHKEGAPGRVGRPRKETA